MATSNGIPPPSLNLPYPEGPEDITANVLKLTELTPNPRVRFVFKSLISKLHEFISETNITTDEWHSVIEFLARTGQEPTSPFDEFDTLSEVLGASALVETLNNPRVGNATESSFLGPHFTEDAPDLSTGESIASEGKGEYMYVEGRVLTTSGEPILGAVIETWEVDGAGLYDTQYAQRTAPECRGRLKSGEEGKYGYRAVVPASYFIRDDGPVGELLLALGRHNGRPSHLHMTVDAPGFHKLTTALYPEGDQYVSNDAIFGVKKSLVVKLIEIDDEVEARKHGFQNDTKFKLLSYDFVLPTEDEWAAAYAQRAKANEVASSSL